LDWNKLTSIPPETGKLTNLQKLHLDHNELKSIPPEIGKLTNLQLFADDKTKKQYENLKFYRNQTINESEEYITASNLKELANQKQNQLSILLEKCKAEAEKSNRFYMHDESIDEWIVTKLITLGFTVDKESCEIHW
jgi:Leucine-rich repeat (LRR) protein